MEPITLSNSAQRVQDTLNKKGITMRVVEMPESTRSAQEAAAAIGCTVSQIAKTLVFTTEDSNPLLIIASGTNRVNEKTIKKHIGKGIGKADVDYAREQTGFSIGGIPPIGHTRPIQILIDEDLLKHDEIWAAAGTPHAVFPLTSKELQEITGGEVICVT